MRARGWVAVLGLFLAGATLALAAGAPSESEAHAMVMPREAVTAAALRAPTCRRPNPGDIVGEPPDLFSANGALSVNLDYLTSTDPDQRRLFCFVTPDGLESPTLHVRPGDLLTVTLRNRLPDLGPAGMAMATGRPVCGAATMTAASVNLHFHGLDTPPVCHGDEVLHTLINAGDTFIYRIRIPPDTPPGLYWYHPHVHGQSEEAVQGGASGAIVVEGLARARPDLAGLGERLLILRDETRAAPKGGAPVGGGVASSASTTEPAPPAWDLTVNYVPVTWPALTPAEIRLPPGRRELWRVLNASAGTVADLAFTYDGIDQPLRIVALDGVPVGRRAAETVRHILIPAAGRAEFLLTAPRAGVKRALLATRAVDTGPDGDKDTARVLARIRTVAGGGDAPARLASRAVLGPPVSGSALAMPPEPGPITARRRLYFSEVPADQYDPSIPAQYFITREGARPQAFRADAPPAVVTRQGAVELWTVENRSHETHEFHIHQIHFTLMARDGAPLPVGARPSLDTTIIPYWSGHGPYPSVTLLLDFRGAPAGDILFHCHMLEHEDGGMMAVARVLPAPDGDGSDKARASD